MRTCAFKTVVFPSGRSFLINCPKAPLWRIPSLTRKSIATVIIPLLLKPSSISLGVNIPTTRNNTTTESSIIPGRILSHTNAATIPARAINTNNISKFIMYLICLIFSDKVQYPCFQFLCLKVWLK